MVAEIVFFVMSWLIASNDSPLRQDLRQQRAADGRVHHAHRLDARSPFGAAQILGQADLDLGLQVDVAALVGAMHFCDVTERHALALRAHALASHVIQPEHDVLRRHDDRVAVRGRENVVRRHHQRARFELRFDGQRHVDGHLVAVEVGVERRTDERMELDGLAFDQHRLESLDAEAVQGRCAVQEHRMLADHLLEDVPHLRAFALDEALGRLDRSMASPRI